MRRTHPRGPSPEVGESGSETNGYTMQYMTFQVILRGCAQVIRKDP
jgi:hypothetical protein